MKMLFTGCVQCGKSTQSVQGTCPDCDLAHSTSPSPRPRLRLTTLRRQATRSRTRSS